MALSAILADAGHTADSVKTSARVTLRFVDDAPTITRIDLDVAGSVPGIDEDAFRDYAATAKGACLVSPRARRRRGDRGRRAPRLSLMDLCVMIEGQEGVSWSEWRAIATACEEHGIPALFRSDHYLPLGGILDRQVLDAWATINALAATTSTLRLGTLVSPATFRHPSVLAKLAVTADHVSGGRIELGMGAGWNQPEHHAYGFPFPETATRVAMLEEQVEIVHGLFGEGSFAFGGTHYRLAGVDALPKPVQPGGIPIVIGGSGGPRSAALAARFAREYNTPFATVEQVRERRARVDASLRFSVMTGAILGRDAAEVERRTRAVAAKRGEPGFEAPQDSWIVGPPEEAIAHLRALADAGVDRVMLDFLLHDDLDQIELIGRELARSVGLIVGREEVRDVRLAARQLACALLDPAVDRRQPALVLAQVLLPRPHLVGLEEPLRVLALAVQAPAHRPGAATRALHRGHRLDERRLVLLGHVVGERDDERAAAQRPGRTRDPGRPSRRRASGRGAGSGRARARRSRWSSPPGRPRPRSASSAPRRAGDDAPDHGRHRLAAHEDELVGAQPAGPHPVGQDELHRGVRRGEHREPREAGRHEHRDDEGGAVREARHGARAREREEREHDEPARVQARAQAREKERARDRPDPERREQEPVALRIRGPGASSRPPAAAPTARSRARRRGGPGAGCDAPRASCGRSGSRRAGPHRRARGRDGPPRSLGSSRRRR